MIRGVIFDLDGVVVSTDEWHYQAWKQVADEEGIPFSEEQGHRCRGISRMEAVDLIVRESPRIYSEAEKAAISDRKNNLYLQMIKHLSPEAILPGVKPFLKDLRQAGLLQMIGSGSKNTPAILRRIGLHEWFDAVADGNDIRRSKPDPEVFLLAAQRAGLPLKDCVVVEDAVAGVEAALKGGARVLAVGAACGRTSAHASLPDLKGMTAVKFLALFGEET